MPHESEDVAKPDWKHSRCIIIAGDTPGTAIYLWRLQSGKMRVLVQRRWNVILNVKVESEATKCLLEFLTQTEPDYKSPRQTRTIPSRAYGVTIYRSNK